MAWKTIFNFGQKNLTGNSERIQALCEVRGYLKDLGCDSGTINTAVEHEKKHLFAFSDFEANTGKKLGLVLQRDPDEGIRLAVVPNRLQLRDEVRTSVGAVDDPSEGDKNYGAFSRFRKR